MKHKILFVDDDENVLFSIKRTLRTANFDLLTAYSGKEGLSILENTTVGVIVSDMKMPAMNGAEFLKEAINIRPDAVRIILSAYSDSDNIMAAVNEGSIWRYISKPWDSNDLKMTLKNALDLYEKNIEMQELIIALKEKTNQLDAMNKLLEKKVKQRTWLLNERSQLLTMLVEDTDIGIILWRVCSSISKFLNGKSVYIVSPFLHHITAAKGGEAKNGELPPLISELAELVINSKINIKKEDSLGIFLKKSETLLGVLLIDAVTESESSKTTNSISSFISFLEIALFQYKLSNNTPELLDNIDKLMGYI
jgi:DNA-binding response OmpR family regulator